MPSVYAETLEERLRVAEQAETEVSRLQPLASEAPSLRTEKAKKDKSAEQERVRMSHMDQARQCVGTANDKQARVPELLGSAARAINELYTTLRQIENLHKEAAQALSVADRVEYEQELETAEEQDDANARDHRGIAFVLAGRHGESRVKQLMDDLHPEVNLLQGCNLDEPLYRDVAHFVMEQVEKARSPRAARRK